MTGRFTIAAVRPRSILHGKLKSSRWPKKTIEVLGCQGYCGVDVVVADKVYVVDVNPRITTSLVGIAACMKEEIADILVAASKGEGTEQVHLTGSARFDTKGNVSRV